MLNNRLIFPYNRSWRFTRNLAVELGRRLVTGSDFNWRSCVSFMPRGPIFGVFPALLFRAYFMYPFSLCCRKMM